MTKDTSVHLPYKESCVQQQTRLKGHHIHLQEQVGTGHDSHLNSILRTSWSIWTRQFSYSLCKHVILCKPLHKPLSHGRRFLGWLIVVTEANDNEKMFGCKRLPIPKAKHKFLELRDIFLDLMFKTDECLGRKRNISQQQPLENFRTTS